jgi:ankyrin repeat protein
MFCRNCKQAGGLRHIACILIAGLPCLAQTAPLGEAVRSGDLARVRALLNQHVDVNAPESDGSTALDWAVETDNAELAKLLLKAGASAATRSRDGVSPLSLAAENRNLEIAKALLDAGADANESLPGGETVLMAAARTGNAEVVKLLLARGARVDQKGNEFGETALMIAAAANQDQAAAALIAHGAEVNGRSATLEYPKDRFGLEGVVTILPHGDWTPLMYAGRQGSAAAARVLCEAGAEVNAVDPDGTSALLLAIMNGHFDTAAVLLEHGADANLTDKAGMGPLYATVDMNTLGEVYGRPPRASTGKLTALELMNLLIENGANPNAGLKSATLQRAHTPGESTLGAGATPLMRAAKNGDVAAIELLIAHGADVSLGAKNLTTPLMFAAGLGRGVGTFAKDYATDAEMLAAAKALIAHGAEVNAVSAAGQTAVHFAAQATDVNLPQPSDDMVRLLAAHGAKLDVADKQGRTPVEMAQGKGLRGRAGGPVAPRESTIALLRSLNVKTPENVKTAE